jgi:hypothetical protein
MSDEIRAELDKPPIKTPAHHTAVGGVLKYHGLTDVGDGVLEADLIYAVLGVKETNDGHL